MGIKNWVRQRVTLVAGQAQIYEPKQRSTNALYFINNNASEVKAAAWSDVANNPEVTVKANSSAPMPLSAPGEAVYLYCASTVTITLVEMTTDDLAVVFAMQVVVSDAVSVTGNVGILGSLPAGTNNIGDVDVLTIPGTAVSGAAPPAVVNMIAGSDGVTRIPFVSTLADGAGLSGVHNMATFATNYGYNGTTSDRLRIANVSKQAASGAVAAAGYLTVWTPAAGKKFRLHTVIISVTVTGSYMLYDAAGSTLIADMWFLANTPYVFSLPVNGYISVVANNSFAVKNNTAGAAGIGVWALGNEE